MLEIPIRKLCWPDFWSSWILERAHCCTAFKSPNCHLTDVSASLPWSHKMPFVSVLLHPPVHLLLSFATLCIDKGKRPTETDMHSGWSGRLVICSNSQFWVDHYMQMVASWWSADWEPKHLWSEDSTRKCWKVWEWQEKVEESAAIWISTEHIWTSLSTDVQLITWWWCRCAEIFTIWIN